MVARIGSCRELRKRGLVVLCLLFWVKLFLLAPFSLKSGDTRGNSSSSGLLNCSSSGHGGFSNSFVLRWGDPCPKGQKRTGLMAGPHKISRRLPFARDFGTIQTRPFLPPKKPSRPAALIGTVSRFGFSKVVRKMNIRTVMSNRAV